MLLWLLALPLLVSAMQPPPSIQEALNADVLKVVFKHLGLIGLYETPSVSQRFHSLALEVLLPIYGITYNGQTCLNYSLIMHEFAALVKEALEGADKAGASTEARAEAYAALKSTPEYMCMKIILEAEFGACIGDEDGKIVLPPGLTMLDLLGDAKKLSALPYLLDQYCDSQQWVFCIQGLVDLGRSDILGLLQFPKITEAQFYQLLSITLIEPNVLQVAAKSLVYNEPEGHLAKLVAFAVLGDTDAPIPSGPVPLFVLQHLYERQVALPEAVSFTGGLEAHSISFWMHVKDMDCKKADEILSIAIERGDVETRGLAGVFTSVSPIGLEALSDAQVDVYRAMLIRLSSSRPMNEHARENHRKAFSAPRDICYHTACALLDCGESEQFHLFKLYHDSRTTLRALVDKMSRLKDRNSPAIVRKYLEADHGSAKSLKLEISHNDDDQRIQSLWESIQAKPGMRTIAEHCCMLPLSTLRRLITEPDISVNNVRDLLSEVQAYQAREMWLSRENAVLYTLLFWGVRDEVADALLGRV